MIKQVDRNGFEVFETGHGKKPNQKLKPYLVLQYLLHQSDENHVLSAENIVGYLQETCGIYAERRSIYRDIEEINKAMLMVEYEIDVHEAEERLEEDEREKLVCYDKRKKASMCASVTMTQMIFDFWPSVYMLPSFFLLDRQNALQT